MPFTTVSVGAAVTPTVIKTYISHYTNRSPRRQKPTAHISYDEGLHLIRSFLTYASHHTVEDLQAFTAQWVPSPAWVRTENVSIPQDYVARAAEMIIAQLGPEGVHQIGGTQWWQWRRKNSDLKAEWIEMRADYNARKQLGENGRRVMLYVHGGAYFFGSVDEHRYQMQRHARKLKAQVFAPRYRLAPQFPFPCGIQDCLAAYLYLLSIHDRTQVILAGDSAGGGMVVSILCMLRDQGLPLPAGAILISPWVDLTHSFPSVAGGSTFDYIPAHGFMHRPSAAWPPPNDDEMEIIKSGAGKDLLQRKDGQEKQDAEREAAQGFAVRDLSPALEVPPEVANNGPASPSSGRTRAVSIVPGPNRYLQIEIDGKLVELKDQIQMYATNQLISHPLVSPVLQPSLGGLPPLLITTGGGEILRDEQIYLAHKAANPQKYPLGDEYRNRYDPDDKILNKYKPTAVQLQVWEDLCHVTPTLSFTRPAKFMYRSVAQFGAWALARAQNTSIELMDDDNISVISTDSNSSSIDSVKKQKLDEQTSGSVGRAGDPIPIFKHHMIRQLVDRHGNLHPLGDESELPALQMSPSEVGVIKVGPVRKWMAAKVEWNTRFARIKRKVQKRRIADLVKGDSQSFEGEEPPPSALAGRRKEEDILMRKPKKSYGLALWSGWGSRHDEDTIKREEEVVKYESKLDKEVQHGEAADEQQDEKQKSPDLRSSSNTLFQSSTNTLHSAKSRPNYYGRSRSRMRTRAVSDVGQLKEEDDETSAIGILLPGSQTTSRSKQQDLPTNSRSDITNDNHLSPMFTPKFKMAPHLRSDSRDMSDTASVRTGHSVLMSDNASTSAVFSAAGVTKERNLDTTDDYSSSFFPPVTARRERSIDGRPDTGASTPKTDDHRSNTGGVGGIGGHGGSDTPRSRRSVERLMSHQINVIGADGESIVATENSGIEPGPSSVDLSNQLSRLRSPSSIAIVQHDGVVDVVEGGVADTDTDDVSNNKNNVDVDDDHDLTPTQERQKISLTPTPPVPASTTTTTTDTIDHHHEETKPERPGMYDRGDSEFKTAMEIL